MTQIVPMKFALPIAAALALGACSQQAATNNEAEVNLAIEPAAEPAEVNAPATATPAAVPAGSAPTVDYMVGKWSATEGDCSSTLEFRKDGTVVTPIGDAKWTLDGNQLAVNFGDNAKPDPTTVTVLTPDTIETTMKSGRKEVQKRC